MKITDTHVYFWRGLFSNWHPIKFFDPNAGLTFNNTEQGFMWYKARLFGNNDIAELISKEVDPQKCKKFGREIRNYNEEKWKLVREESMFYVNKLKYEQNNEAARQLVGTKDKILVEASPYDEIWGVKLREEDPLILDEKNWLGLNLLGITLMKVRDYLEK